MEPTLDRSVPTEKLMAGDLTPYNQSAESLANWNGQVMPLSEVRVSVLDRGFLFGDSIYEVIRVYGGKPFHFDEHLARLARNLRKLEISIDAGLLASRALETLALSRKLEATIYFQITRGEAPRTHAFPKNPVAPNALIAVQPYDDSIAPLREQGARAILLKDIRWKRCDIKSTNLLANCLGAEQARQAGAYEGIYVTDDGELLEGTRTSLFAVKSQSLVTPPLGQNLLPGITRSLVLELASSVNLGVIEAPLQQASLDDYEEMFVTGTTTEIMPIVEIDQLGEGAFTKIGTGKVGPVVRRLQQAYAGIINQLKSTS